MLFLMSEVPLCSSAGVIQARGSVARAVCGFGEKDGPAQSLDPLGDGLDVFSSATAQLPRSTICANMI